MSRFKYVFFSIITFGLFTVSANAASCSYEERAELNNQITNMEMNYEVIRIALDPDEFSPPDFILGTPDEEGYVEYTDALQVNILNLTENTYVEVTNNYDNQTIRYDYSDTDNGNIAIVWETLGEFVTYTARVYASSNTGCEDTLLRTMRVSLPRYNDYSTYGVCEQVPDYYLCQRYVFFDEIDFDEFSTKVLAEIEKTQNGGENGEEDNPWYEEIGNFISEHKTPIIIGIVSILIIAGVIVVIVVRKRRRSVI